jgi:hypothetical protein
MLKDEILDEMHKLVGLQNNWTEIWFEAGQLQKKASMEWTRLQQDLERKRLEYKSIVER